MYEYDFERRIRSRGRVLFMTDQSIKTVGFVALDVARARIKSMSLASAGHSRPSLAVVADPCLAPRTASEP
jgi:hypothetical protein